MFGILDSLKLGAVALGSFLGGAAIFYTIGHWQGEDAGREAARVEALQRSMELIRERSETNAEIDALDDAALCRELGGVWVQPDNICQ